jgi:hypothetical protein
MSRTSIYVPESNTDGLCTPLPFTTSEKEVSLKSLTFGHQKERGTIWSGCQGESPHFQSMMSWNIKRFKCFFLIENENIPSPCELHFQRLLKESFNLVIRNVEIECQQCDKLVIHLYLLLPQCFIEDSIEVVEGSVLYKMGILQWPGHYEMFLGYNWVPVCQKCTIYFNILVNKCAWIREVWMCEWTSITIHLCSHFFFYMPHTLTHIHNYRNIHAHSFSFHKVYRINC